MDSALTSALPDREREGQSLAEKTVLALSRALSVAQSYDADHPMRREALRLIDSFFGANGPRQSDSLLLCVGSRIVVNGLAAGPDTEGLPELRDSLKRRRLRGLSLPRAMTRDEAEALLALMTARPQDLEGAGGGTAFLRTRGAQGRIELLEVPREGTVGELDEGQSQFLAEVVRRYVFNPRPPLTPEEVALLRDSLVRPSSIARALSAIAEFLQHGGEDVPRKTSAIGVLERIFRHIKELGGEVGPALRADVADALAGMDPAQARSLVRESLLRDPDPDSVIGSGVEWLAKAEIAHILAESHTTGAAIPSPVVRSIGKVFGGESGRQKLTALLRSELTSMGVSRDDMLRDLTRALERAQPAAGGTAQVDRLTEDALNVLAAIESFDYEKRYTYVLLELTLLARDVPEMSVTMEPLAGKARQAIEERDYATARDIIVALHEFSEDEANRTAEMRMAARMGCRQVAESDAFKSGILPLSDEQLRSTEGVWDILGAVRSHIADWLLDRVASCSDPQTLWQFSQMLMGIKDEVAEKLRARLKDVRLSRSETLFNLMYRTDKTGFLRLCGQQLGGGQVGASIDIVQALGRLRDPDSVGLLRTALGSSNAWLRQEVVYALGRIGSLEAADILRELAERPAWFGPGFELRRTAVEALGNIRNETSVPLLAGLLEKRHPLFPRRNKALRLQAAAALGMIGGGEALQALRKACRDRDREVRAACEDALRRPGNGSETRGGPSDGTGPV